MVWCLTCRAEGLPCGGADGWFQVALDSTSTRMLPAHLLWYSSSFTALALALMTVSSIMSRTAGRASGSKGM